MARATFAVAVFLACVGCASEAERYSWNREHPNLCPNARWLTAKDIDEIARVLSRATPQTIMAISSNSSHRKLDVTTCYHGALQQDPPQRGSFGFCTLDKVGDGWKATYIGTDLDPVLALGMACVPPR